MDSIAFGYVEIMFFFSADSSASELAQLWQLYPYYTHFTVESLNLTILRGIVVASDIFLTLCSTGKIFHP